MTEQQDAPQELREKVRILRARVAELEAAAAQSQGDHAALSDTELRFHSFMDNSPVAAWIKDEDGYYVYVNRMHERLFGYQRHEQIGKTDQEIHPPDVAAQLRANDVRVLQTNTVLQTVENAPVLDGTSPHWLVCKFPMKDSSGRRFVGGVALDVTEQKQAEAQLHRASRLQQLLLQELDHRVRNNLASLLALIDITEQSAQSVQEFASSIRDRVHAIATVHSLLSRDRGGVLHLQDLLVNLVPEHTRCQLQPAGPPVPISPRQSTALGMVLHELIVNSLKYGALSASQGAVHVKWSVTESSDQHIAVELHWRENNGPPVCEPTTAKLGTALMTGLTRSELQGSVVHRYPPNGADHTLRMKLEREDPSDL